ncbi:MAG: dihydroorotase [Bacteroidota bacterium]
MVLFRNVTITDSSSKYNGQTVDVLVNGHHIESIAEAGSLSVDAAQVVEGGHLSPGWVDMRVYITDPGHEWKDDLESTAASAAAGGFTRILAMPNTAPALDNSGLIRALVMRSEALPVTIMPAGALSEGTQGENLAELYDMHLAGAAAFTDGLHPTDSAGLLLRGLQYLKPFGSLLMDMPLDQSLNPGAEVGEGEVAIGLGMKGIPEIAEELRIDRNLKLHGYFPHRLLVGPVTTAGALQRLANTEAEDLFVETSAMYLLLDDGALSSFDENAKVFPPLRPAASVVALRKAVVDGTVDVISSSHHPQGIEEKVHDFQNAAFGALMLETAFGAICTAMEGAEIGLDRLVDCISGNPRRILGLDAATIEAGAAAELTHFDPNESWEVSKADFRSKSANTPLIGKTLKGRPLGIYAKGQYLPR